MSSDTQLDLCPETVVPKVDENRRYTTRAFMFFIKRVAGVDAWDLDPAADLESHHAPRWFCAPGDLPVPAPSDARRKWVDAGCIEVDGLRFTWLPECTNSGLCCARRDGVVCPDDSCDLFDGLLGPWRIFINPPFDNIGPWLTKVWATIAEARREGLELRIAFVMPGNRTEQGFWQDHVEPFLEGHERAGREGYKLVAHSPRTRQFYGHPGNPEPKSGQAEWPSVVLIWRRA